MAMDSILDSATGNLIRTFEVRFQITFLLPYRAMANAWWREMEDKDSNLTLWTLNLERWCAN